MSLTEMMRNALGNSNFACGGFIDLQKAFDTVNHDILLSDLNHYDTRGVAFDRFKRYLKHRTQCIPSINENIKSKLLDIAQHKAPP